METRTTTFRAFPVSDSIRTGVLMALAIFGLAAGFTALIVLASWLICSDE